MGVATRIIYFCAVQKAEEAVIRVPRMQFCSTCVHVLSICVHVYMLHGCIFLGENMHPCSM
jgi:hypothetical protein